MIRVVRNVEIPPDLTAKTLRRGDRGKAVVVLQDLLKATGWTITGPSDGDFGLRTEAAVMSFQQSANLTVDGVVGPASWLVLTSPSLTPAIGQVHLVGSIRAQDVLGVAIGELGETEVPDGSNRGPRIDLYTKRQPIPWCAAYVSWCLAECSWNPWPKPFWAVVDIRQWAIDRKLYETSKTYAPQPGDLFVLLEPGQPGVDPKHGHVGFVLADPRGDTYRTIEGNASNAVRSNTRKRYAVDGFVRVTAA